MIRSSPVTLAAWLALAAAAPGSAADEVRHPDGTALSGRLLGLVFEDQGGGVHALTREDVLVATVSAGAVPRAPVPAVPAPPPAPVDPAGTWGRRAGTTSAPVPAPVVVPAPEPFPAGSVGLGIELAYQGATAGPEAPEVVGELDPGDFAEIFAYKPENVKNRGAWLFLGNATRLVNVKETDFDDADELALVRQMLQDATQTRETILAKVNESRVWRHRMVYRFHQTVPLAAGTWNVYVNFSRLKRHKTFNSVQFAPGKPAVLQYSWTTHVSFGM